MTEVWARIDGFDGYEVSSLGRVRSLDRTVSCRNGRELRFKGRMMKQNRSTSGYLQVVLSKPGLQQNTSVHRLVAEAFIGPIGSGLEVCHNDGNKDNNASDNLRIDNKKGNMADCVAHGTAPQGEKNAGSRLNQAAVLEMREAYAKGMMSRGDLAKRHGISQSHVSAILTGKAWAHVGGPMAPAVPLRGEGWVSAKVRESDVLEMRRRYAEGGVTMEALARDYGITRLGVHSIIRRKSWKHLP